MKSRKLTEQELKKALETIKKLKLLIEHKGEKQDG
jgi:hypothetical protein